MRIINAPSLANCNMLTMGQQVEELVKGEVPWFHIDIMDGHYVPNICFPVKLIGELKEKYPNIIADIHLMVTNPIDYLDDLKDNDADYVSFHVDSSNFSRRIITMIHEKGMKAGVVINPSQQLSIIEPFIKYLDYVVLMTVEPGYAGQKFMIDSLPRVKELVELRKKSGNQFLISIDGGVDYPNAIECAKLGAEIYVTGIYTVFNQLDSIELACKRFTKTLNDAIV